MEFIQDTLELEFSNWNELDEYVKFLEETYDVVEVGQATNAPWNPQKNYVKIRVVKFYE